MTQLDTRAPFVLLDDARSEAAARARLYAGPVEIVTTRAPGEVRACLARLRAAKAEGLQAAGFLAYEAGHALEPCLAPLAAEPGPDEPPLLWFGLFREVLELPAEELPAMLPDPASAWAGAPRPRIARPDYEAAVDAVKRHIAAGDIYQANLTYQADISTAGPPLALYAALRERARGGHGGIVFTSAHWLLSFSPELFFTLDGGRILTRPMKGTAMRGEDAAADRAAAEALRSDPKQRAENLIIVDLLRNDLSRVATTGSVQVPSLFAIETYPTVHQMTSTVTARLEDGLDAIDVMAALFPCGSVTGAPKIRAMELIQDIERAPRRAYTGSIGWIGPGGAAFNVAIRTLTMKEGENGAVMGLGSAIVADSHAGDEWLECLAKGAFVNDAAGRFDLIETMRFDPDEGLADLERHLARMKTSAAALDFAFDRHAARNELQAATFRLRKPSRIRLLLSRSGALAVETRPLPSPAPEPVAVALTPRSVSSDNFRLRHKTSNRAFYDEPRRASGVFELLFTDSDGFLTEGSFTTIFVERDGRLLTPPLSRGVLPGILREKLIEEGRAIEADLRPEDLADGFFVGNALRGLVPAVLEG